MLLFITVAIEICYQAIVSEQAAVGSTRYTVHRQKDATDCGHLPNGSGFQTHTCRPIQRICSVNKREFNAFSPCSRLPDQLKSQSSVGLKLAETQTLIPSENTYRTEPSVFCMHHDSPGQQLPCDNLHRRFCVLGYFASIIRILNYTNR